MSSAAETSEDFDNPWESAANDQVYRSTSLRVVDAELANSSADAATSSSPGQSNSLKHRVLWGNQILDGFLSALFIIFCFFLYHKNANETNTTQRDVLGTTLFILFAILASILLLRSVIGRRSFHFNMNSRPILLLAYLVTATVLFADAKNLPEWILKVEFGKKEILPLGLLFLAALEVVLFLVLRHCHLSELEDIQDAENLARYTTQSGHSPWWWSNSRNGRRDNGDENLQEPLLFGQPSWTNTSHRNRARNGGDNGSSSSSWWPFSGRSSGPNARDDGSVDYASLNEDWASRSQADPYWWSRDGDGDN